MKKKGLLIGAVLLVLLLVPVVLLDFMAVGEVVDGKEDIAGSEVYYAEFPKDIELTGTGFVVEDELMRYPFRIRCEGDYLYVLDLHGESDFCHIYNKMTLSHVASFAKRGNGPQEVLQAMNIHVVSEDSVWLFDTDRKEVTRWDFCIQDSTVVLREHFRMKEDMILSSNCAWVADSTFFFTDKSGNNRIVRCGKSGDTLEGIGTIPSTRHGEDKDAVLAQAWNSYMDYHSQKQLLVVATQLGDVIEIYDLKNCTCRVLYGPGGEPEYRTASDGFPVSTGIMGYNDVRITDRYIYAVFQGRSFKDIMKDPYGTLDGGKYIHVYDYDGTPVCRLILDHEIYGIDVDEEKGILWATDVNTEEQILFYKLPF